MEGGVAVLIAFIVAIFSVMAWHKEALLVLNGWEPVESKNPFKQISGAFRNVFRALKNAGGLGSDIMITTWAAGIGGAGSTLGFIVGLLISDVVSIYVCSWLYKVSPLRAIVGIITGNFHGKQGKHAKVTQNQKKESQFYGNTPQNERPQTNGRYYVAHTTSSR